MPVGGNREAGFNLLDRHPTYSLDLNAIEGWWAALRQRLTQIAPTDNETREALLTRLWRTVSWLNANKQEQGRRMCEN